jgi:hypothetical protein
MHINKLFAVMAAMVPTSVEFHIHQVVPVFQHNMAIKICQKKAVFFKGSAASTSKGIQATKISRVRLETGQAAISRQPANRVSAQRVIVFTE